MQISLDALDNALDDGVFPSAVVVPSTPAVFEWARQLRRRHPEVLIVAPRVESAVTPVELVCLLRADPRPPKRVVVFSDQLTSPVDAPLPIARASGVCFVSTLEAILHLRYGYRLLVWQGHGAPSLIQASQPIEVASALLGYLDACAALGEHWIQRDAQIERHLSHRAAAAQRELRYFTSVAYHAFRSDPLMDRRSSALDRIDGASRAISAIQRVA